MIIAMPEIQPIDLLPRLTPEKRAELNGDWRATESFIGPALRDIRLIVTRISQKELTRRLDEKLIRRGAKPLDNSYVSKIEHGKRTLTLERLFAWCEALEQKPENVLDYSGVLTLQARSKIQQIVVNQS